MTSDRSAFESLSSIRGDVTLADKTKVVYEGYGSVRLSCSVGSSVFVLLLSRVLYVPTFWKSLFSWWAVKALRKYNLIDDGNLRIVRKCDSVVILQTK